MTNQNTSTTIYVVSYGEYKIPDKEYADGFRWAWCDGIAVGAYTDRAVAEAVAMASERGHLTSVTLNEVSENYRHILEGMGRDQQLPARNQTAENPLAAFLNLASVMGKVFLSVSAAVQHDYEFPQKIRSNSDLFWGALWRLGDSLRDFHEFGDFYAKPVHEDNEWGTVRAWAKARIIGCADNTRNLFEVISKADPALADRLTYLTDEVEKAAMICLKQIEKQIGHDE
jgi:hypothetical protein